MDQYSAWMLKQMNIETDQVDQLLKIQNHPLDSIFDQAKSLILKALDADQKIFIGGDYDADGVCGTTILMKLFKSFDAQVGYYIPDRLKEGYGIPLSMIEAAVEKGYDFFIFVDNGVSLHEQLAYLKAHDKVVMILDHHSIEREPVCDLLIHPDALSPYYHGLCGAGLAYLLSEAMEQADEAALQLAMVATIGDMVPLVGFNRDLVKRGLKSINEAPMLHLSNLVKKQKIDEEDIAYYVVPKLNAIGRLSDVANVNTLVNFFLSDEVSLILSYIQSIESINNQRKQLVKSMQKQALGMLNDEPFNFVVDEGFHQGVVGILAGHIMRLTNKPTLVATIKDNIIKGSLRAEHVDLYEVITRANRHVKQFGGHQKAAGIEVYTHDFEAFKTSILEHMDDYRLDEKPRVVPVIPESLVSMEAIKAFETFGPFGMGFERPMIGFSKVKIVRRLHNASYGLSKWIFKVNEMEIEALTFNEVDEALKGADKLTFVGQLQYKPYNGYDKAILKLEKVLSKNINDSEILI